MNASKKNRGWMVLTICILLPFIIASLGLLIFYITPNLIRDFHLMRSSTVTRGTVVSIGSCWGGSTSPTYDVQFIDNRGRTWVENVSGCNNFVEEWSVGDSISIRYAPDDPTVFAAQDRFTDKVQFDEGLAVFVGVITIGMILAILLIPLLPYLMAHQGTWLISHIKKRLNGKLRLTHAHLQGIQGAISRSSQPKFAIQQKK